MFDLAGKKNFSILIVDDEPKNVTLLSIYLKNAGYLFDSVNSGKEALRLVQQKTYDLILLDIMMPEMDGYEVCKKLKRGPETTDIVVIFLSANSEMTHIVHGFEVGAVDYITKPFNKKELLARLGTHLELKEYRDLLDKLVEEKTSELHERNRDLEAINNATRHFVPFQFLNILGKRSVVDVKLGDQIYGEMTIMFSDLRGYTDLSETMTPQEVFDFTNGYHSRMSPLIRKFNGFVQQFQGDGVVSVFPGEATESVRSAIDIQKKLKRYNIERGKKNRQLLKVGIGLHTGALMVGIIGDEERWESGVPSDTVNTAARLEGLTKVYGSSIIISEVTYNGLVNRDQYSIRYLDKVRMKGKQIPITIYEVLDGDPKESRKLKFKTLNDFNEGLELYYARNFKSALIQFHKVLAINPNDQTVNIYLKRTTHFIKSGVSEDWDGITVFNRK